MTSPAIDRDAGQETLGEILGGPRSALDATLPATAFAGAWLVAGHSVVWAVATSAVVGACLTGWRMVRGGRPLAALLGLLGTFMAGLIVLHTGRAADFFLVQLVSNTVSALVWTISIVVRWPLLGVVVGLVLGQRARWRADGTLVRAYSRGSWVWVGQYAVRMAVLWPLWFLGQVVGLGVARLVLSWPLVAVCLAVSWLVVRRSLGDHPGLRHPGGAEA